MRKIRLSDTDLELFDIEIGPTDYLFYQRHKDAFKTMYREQGKPFWTRFEITFRSFTVKHGIIKQMNIDSPKFQNLLDQAFIFIHEHFVDAKESTAKNFIDDVARLAQNQDKFPALDSKSFAKDPFFTRDTRELFRKFFGPPDQKSSYLKVYILCPVYLRFGGSVCRCLIRWMDAQNMSDPNDDSYWVPPQPSLIEKLRDETIEVAMCENCADDCGTKFLREKIMGNKHGPVSMEFWTLGDPRFEDKDNPLFAPHLNPDDDWRNVLTVDMFKDFYNYARFNYGKPDDKCNECHRLKKKRDKFIHVCKVNKKKKKQETRDKEELIKDLKEVRSRIDELEEGDIQGEDYEARIKDIIKDKPRVREALEEVGIKPPVALRFEAERKEKLEKLHNEQLKAEEVLEKVSRRSKKKAILDKQKDNAELTKESDTSKNTINGKGEKKGGESTGNMDINGEVKDSDSETSSRESSVEKEIDESTDSENIVSEKDSLENDKIKNTGVESETSDSLFESKEKSASDRIDAKEDSNSLNEEPDNRNSEDTVDSSQNGPFSTETTKCDQAHYSFLSDKDESVNRNIVSGFKVIKIEDADNGLFEVNVSAACLKSDEEEKSYTAEMKEKLKSQELNNFIMSANLLREKIIGLPQKLEWWEGRGFAVAVVNYEEEEKEFTKKWTHFTLKINGYDESAIKQTLIQLLIYVSKRKRRICYGWNMEVDDVVACILPEDSPAIEDLSISISRGFRFEDRLTGFEKESLLKHYPNLNLDKVLCGIEKGAAVKTLEKKGGREKLRKIIDTVAEREILAKELPSVNVDKLRKKLNKEEITKADILWEQLIRKPENFEFFVLLEKEMVMAENDWWSLGMRSMDIRHYNNTKNPERKICPMCKTIGMECSCEKPIEIAPKVIEFVEKSDFEKIKVLGDEDGPQLPKMKYTETNLSMEKADKSEKKSKHSKAAKKKEKRIELSELPAKFLEAGIDADKTTITIPSRDEEPMMGKVPIPVSDKLERLAPVPGVQSSLNFTFQNGKKEQTITVTLGAYMPEEKINEIQDKKDQLRLLEEEEKRRNKQLMALPEKKEKKKEKKSKSKSKSTQKPLPVAKADGNNGTKKEKTADTAARFLQEVFGDEEKLDKVAKALYQHMGLTSKKPGVLPSRVELEAQAAEMEMLLQPQFEEIKTMTEAAKKERMNDMMEEFMDIIDNKKTSKKYRHLYMPKVVNTDVGGDVEMKGATEEGKDFEKKPNGKRTGVNAEIESAHVDRIPDESEKGIQDVGKDVSSDEKANLQAGNVRLCGNCEKVEPARKTFKKCQRCKDEGVLDTRYYCSRDCQSMIDNIGGPRRVNNFLTTLNIPSISNPNLKVMERRAGVVVEAISDRSTHQAAKDAYHKEMMDISTNESNQAAAGIENLDDDLGVGLLCDSSPSVREILQSNSTVTVPDDDGWTDDEENGENVESDTNKQKCRKKTRKTLVRSSKIRKQLLPAYPCKTQSGMSLAVDTAWQKRGFDSLTGHTFFMSKAKYGKKVCKTVITHRTCGTCKYWQRNRHTDTVRPHRCVANHTGSARMIESVSGEQGLDELHKSGIAVEYIEGDGDSTMMARVRNKYPHLKKRYDKNHVVKNVGKNFLGLQASKKAKISRDTVRHIQKCLTYSLSKNQGDKYGLKENLESLIPHQFGDHSKCHERFCGSKANPAVKYTHKSLPHKTALKDDGILRSELEKIMAPVVANSSAYADLGSSQQCEHANREVALRAPKTHHYGESESLDFRVKATAACINEGREYLCQAFTEAGLSPGFHTMKHAEKRLQERKKELDKAAIPSTKRRRLILKHDRAMVQGTQEVVEGDTYDSGVALDSALDTETIPDPVPRGNFSSVQTPSGEITVVVMDLETTDLMEDWKKKHKMEHKDGLLG